LSTPFIYATATFGFFHYLDKQVSDEAKKAISGWLQPREYDKAAVAHAMVEIFDGLYTQPLLGWRAFLRSACIKLIIMTIFLYEIGFLGQMLHFLEASHRMRSATLWEFVIYTYTFFISMLLVTNLACDYVSLFVVRRWLIIAGARPFIALLTGPLVGAVIILFLFYLRFKAWYLIQDGVRYLYFNLDELWGVVTAVFLAPFTSHPDPLNLAVLPALAVHLWLPLLALCIVLLKALNWLRIAVGKAQWFFKEGKEHPLDAIGYVAATLVFAQAQPHCGWQASLVRGRDILPDALFSWP
jgi:hypothetical protein